MSLESTFAKVIQFGDQYPHMFTFLPFENEEDWSDDHTPNTSRFPDLDGAYDFNDGQSPKDTKTITKRFTLFSKCYMDYYTSRDKVCGVNKAKNNESGYLRWLRDWMYRGLKGDKTFGGAKRLYVQMEDGSIRWTWAKATSLPYQKSFADAKLWTPFVVDFEILDPYFYEVNNGATFVVKDLPIDAVVCPCNDIDFGDQSLENLLFQEDLHFLDCDDITIESGLPIIIRDESLRGYVGDICSYAAPCGSSPCFQSVYGEGYDTDGDTTVEACVLGSAGAKSPKITFFENFTNPTLTNNNNGNVLTYSGTINTGEYLSIDLGSTSNGEITDLDIDTNIAGFDRNDITINNDGFFILEEGINELVITGGSTNAYIGLLITNLYHN